MSFGRLEGPGRAAHRGRLQEPQRRAGGRELRGARPAEVLARSATGGTNVFETTAPDEKGSSPASTTPRPSLRPRRLLRGRVPDADLEGDRRRQRHDELRPRVQAGRVPAVVPAEEGAARVVLLLRHDGAPRRGATSSGLTAADQESNPEEPKTSLPRDLRHHRSTTRRPSSAGSARASGPSSSRRRTRPRRSSRRSTAWTRRNGSESSPKTGSPTPRSRPTVIKHRPEVERIASSSSGSPTPPATPPPQLHAALDGRLRSKVRKVQGRVSRAGHNVRRREEGPARRDSCCAAACRGEATGGRRARRLRHAAPAAASRAGPRVTSTSRGKERRWTAACSAGVSSASRPRLNAVLQTDPSGAAGPPVRLAQPPRLRLPAATSCRASAESLRGLRRTAGSFTLRASGTARSGKTDRR